MAQYQSFPDAAGDSRTLDKLKALRLPALDGRSFLDIGCNEGFFCGFAKFLGAARSVGLDYSETFIDRASQRFPDCEFFYQSWEVLPEGAFDVILLASALHYADDQPQLIQRLVEQLTPSGVLILELGIVSSPNAEWVKVTRGSDERYFPTMPQLKQTLGDYAWKWMGTSVNQSGDPVARHVIHISHRRPVAYLLMQPPAYGKSSLASHLFVPAGVPVVSGDQIVQRIAQKALQVSTRLQDLVAKDYSPFTIDKLMQRIFDKKLGAELVQAWIAEAGQHDFVLDGFVPAKYHAQVEKQLADADYLPVTLHWERVASSLMPLDSLNKKAEAFYLSMSGKPPPEPAAATTDRPGTGGFVDEVQVTEGQLVIRGWAMDGKGKLPDQLVVGVGAERTFIDVQDTQLRNDVQKHLKLDHALLGYRVTLKVPGLADMRALGSRGFSVSLPSGVPLRMAATVARALKGQ